MAKTKAKPDEREPVGTLYRRKSDEVAMRRVTIWLPEALETELKVHCARTRTKLSGAAAEAIAAYLKGKGAWATGCSASR